MAAERFALLCKVALGLVPIYYSGLVIAILPNSLSWALIVIVVLAMLVVLIAWLGWPLQAIWPAFPGVVLIVVGAMTQTWLLLPIGAIYLLWAARAAWRVRPPA